MYQFSIKLFALLMAAVIYVTANPDIYAGNVKKNRPDANQVNLWRKVTLKNTERREASGKLPEKFLAFELDQAILKNLFVEMPLENLSGTRGKGLLMKIPMPDGTIQNFRMEETPVLSPELARDFPEWKTFIGYGVDDTKAIGRFDWTALGFHGYISTEKGTVLIDPYQRGDNKNYLVYYKQDYGKSSDEFYCRIEDRMSKIRHSENEFNFSPSSPAFSFGSSIRTYRLAVATTGEWSRNAAGYTAGMTADTIRTNALAVITTTVNRLNGIFEREIASRFQLVNPSITDNTKNIVFDDPATDPYDNTDNTAQLTINHNTITSRAGSTEFDIGHLYGTGGGGVAASPSLCDNASKGEGYSARGTNTGDPFVVDYVAHEIGHQFGASHTYNNSDSGGACTTRAADSAFEVASGSTIMSYVGICNQRNLQQYVDTGFPSFHIRSLTQMVNNFNTGDPATTGCGTASGTNTIPTVNAGNAYTIPKLTPFTLTATPNNSNLLYSWEQYDLAPSASGELGNPAGTYDIDSDSILRPLFRAYSPVSANSRTFPSLAFILNPANNDASADVNGVRGNQPALNYTGTHPTGFPGAVCELGQTCVIGERLPTVARTMNFRVSVRNGMGGIADAGTTVTVAAGAGPFQVTTQNGVVNIFTSVSELVPAAVWQGGTLETVTWDVANTNVAPVNAANVKILLSTDGGLTFPFTLAANTPNDGSEQIVVPNVSTSRARIKIEAVDNIFFDINNVNFQINIATAASAFISGRVVSSSGRGINGATVKLTDQNGLVRAVRTNSFGFYRIEQVSVGQNYVVSASHKRHRFSPQVIYVGENLTELNLVAVK